MKKLILSLIFILLFPITVFGAYEDFDDYTKVDPYTNITVTDNYELDCGEEEGDIVYSNDDAYVYKDAGAGHFGTTFEHDFEFTVTTLHGDWGICEVWLVSNVLNDWYYMWDNLQEALTLEVNNNNQDPVVQLGEATQQATSDPMSYTVGTTYYPIVERTGDTTLEARIYSDATRETLADTLNVAVPSGKSYRYFYPFCNLDLDTFNYGSISNHKNYDLNEAAPAARRMFIVQ